MTKTTTRCLSLALAVGVLMLVGSGVAFAQTHSTGLTVSKSCPTAEVQQGATITCSYTITNAGDTQHGVNLTSATETVPCPSPDADGVCGAGAGLPFDVLTPSPTNSGCLQGDPGVAVTSLGPSTSTATRSCTGSFQQVVPFSCATGDATILDKVQAAGTDADTTPNGFGGLPVGNFTTNIINVNGLTCDDGLLCTTDACTPGTGCSTTPVVCNDSNLCTANDACNPATGSTTVCLSTPVVCSDGNLCTTDACDPQTGSTTVCATTPVVCDDGDRCTLDACDPATGSTTACVTQPNPDPTCTDIEGRMTGGGSVFAGLNRVTHGFELHCDELDLPNNLQVNWGRGNQFHLEQLLTATCTDSELIDQTPPGHSPFDTFIGTGIGRCNGVSGAEISFTFVDGGEPGFRFDTVEIEITGCPDGLSLSVSGNLKKGNHQAHRNTPQ